LNYQEQLQMFLFDSDYFIQRIAVPWWTGRLYC
jgi:hypothetical protein